MSSVDERRKAPRFPLRALAVFSMEGKELAAHVLEISVTGARIALLDQHEQFAKTIISLRVEIPDPQAPEHKALTYINLQGTLIYQQDNVLGIKYTPMSDTDNDLLMELLEKINA